jgi:acetaldehyde dehydrogenase
MHKLHRSNILKLTWVVGIVAESEGLRLARKLGYNTTHKGIDELMKHSDEFDIAFDATTARAHHRHADILASSGKLAIDLTPAAVGPYIVPLVNVSEHLNKTNVNLITCGGQATIPIVAAINRVAPVKYAEIVSTVASLSAGPGTRQNIDEFTDTTSRGLVELGGAQRGKAIIILNPATPPIIMRNTIYTQVGTGTDQQAILDSVKEMVDAVKEYVPGYQLKTPPLFDEDIVTVLLEIRGAGDYLPDYAGNLDIMTSAATRVGEEMANHLQKL